MERDRQPRRVRAEVDDHHHELLLLLSSHCARARCWPRWNDGTRRLKLKKMVAAPRGLDARHRLVGPRPHGALTVCESLAFVVCV
jgi:hypothetical protein